MVKPLAELGDVCADDGVAVVLSNVGDDVDAPVDFTVEGVAGTVTVGVGETETVYVPVVEDTDFSITVTAGSYSTTLTGTRDCETDPINPQPEPDAITNPAAATDICVDDGIQVDLSNQGSGVNTAVTFLVSVNGVTRSVEVPAQGEKAEVFSAGEDEPVTVVVTAGDEVVYQLADVRDCIEVEPGEEEPPAEEPTPESPAEEPPAEEEEEQPQQEQPETAVLGTKLPAVQPNASAQTGQLPRTGTDPTGLLALALGLLAAGAAGMIGSSLIGRRRRA